MGENEGHFFFFSFYPRNEFIFLYGQTHYFDGFFRQNFGQNFFLTFQTKDETTAQRQTFAGRTKSLGQVFNFRREQNIKTSIGRLDGKTG
jgi:hypothetical protein